MMAQADGGLLVVTAIVKGFAKPFRVLIGSRALRNYARERSIAENGTVLDEAVKTSKDESVSVKVATGSVVTTRRVDVDLRLKFRDFDAVEYFTVLHVDERYDLIMGYPWLGKHEPWVDWRSRSVGSTVLATGALESRAPSAKPRPAGFRHPNYWDALSSVEAESRSALHVAVCEVVTSSDSHAHSSNVISSHRPSVGPNFSRQNVRWVNAQVAGADASPRDQQAVEAVQPVLASVADSALGAAPSADEQTEIVTPQSRFGWRDGDDISVGVAGDGEMRQKTLVSRRDGGPQGRDRLRALFAQMGKEFPATREVARSDGVVRQRSSDGRDDDQHLRARHAQTKKMSLSTKGVVRGDDEICQRPTPVLVAASRVGITRKVKHAVLNAITGEIEESRCGALAPLPSMVQLIRLEELPLDGFLQKLKGGEIAEIVMI